MSNGSKKNKGNRRRSDRRLQPYTRIPDPPPFQASVIVGKVLRFKATSALVNLVITGVDLLDLWCMADTTVSAFRLMSSVKLRKVEMWGPMASDLVPVTVSCEFNTDPSTGIGGSNGLKSDTSMGSTRAAYLSFKPRDNSVAASWLARGCTSNVMTLNGPINTIVDVHLTSILQNGEAPLAVANALVAATVGTVYLRGLDGVAAATTQLPPVSYATA